MGNHEYCDECGASSFHYGEPCDPERKASHQAGYVKAKRYIEQLDAGAIQLVKSLNLNPEEIRLIRRAARRDLI